jgi:meso-butanediol dehydrogenase/(S,S)-butanediol dehydrogenase/diacetyl reductase
MHAFTPITVVVSGASGGIGIAIVNHFLSIGAAVWGVDKIASTNKHLDRPNYHFLQADLSLWENARQAANRITENSPSLDLLINCAGVFIEDGSIEDAGQRLSFLWQNNVASALYLSNALELVLLKSSSPMVVMVSSADAVVASGGQDCEVGVRHDVLYAATKGALLSLARALAMKWAPRIRVNAICPTIVRTPMAASLLAVPGKEEQIQGHIPLGRICEPGDVAEAIHALYQMKMTTAHLLPVDGGYLCQ